MTEYDLHGLSVLIVDSHAHMRHIIRGIFREFGVDRIREAGSVRNAYEIFCEDPPDLVVTDWSPRVDGLALLDMIRTGEETANPFTPVLMVSANTELRHVCKARDMGTHEFLARPFTAADIYKRVVSIIESPRPFVEAGDFFGPDRRRKDLDIPEERDRRNTEPEPVDASKAV